MIFDPSSIGIQVLIPLPDWAVSSVTVPLMPSPLAEGFALEIELPTDLDTEENNQDWFWSEEWQFAERQVDEDLAAGRFKNHDTMEEFLTGLE